MLLFIADIQLENAMFQNILYFLVTKGFLPLSSELERAKTVDELYRVSKNRYCSATYRRIAFERLEILLHDEVEHTATNLEAAHRTLLRCRSYSVGWKLAETAEANLAALCREEIPKVADFKTLTTLYRMVPEGSRAEERFLERAIQLATSLGEFDIVSEWLHTASRTFGTTPRHVRELKALAKYMDDERRRRVYVLLSEKNRTSDF